MFMRPFFDVETLVVCESVLAIVFALIFIAVRRVFPHARGARVIALSFALVVPDTALVALHAQISPILSVLVAYTLMMGSLMAMYEAILEFTGGENWRWMLWLSSFAGFGTIFFYTDVHPRVGPRIAAIAVSTAMVRASMAGALSRRALRSTQRRLLACYAGFLLALVGIGLYRGFVALTPAAAMHPGWQEWAQSTMLGLGIVYLAVAGLSFLLMTGKELLAQRRMESDWAPQKGTLNRRRLELNLALELEEMEKRRQPFCVVLVEVDTWDSVDEGAAQARHLAVRDIAETLAGQLRSNDHIGRFAKDAFLLFLSKATVAEAIVVMERCAARVQSLSFTRRTRSATFSAGIAEASPQDSAAELLERAETALTLAVFEGGNCHRVQTRTADGPDRAPNVQALV